MFGWFVRWWRVRQRRAGVLGVEFHGWDPVVRSGIRMNAPRQCGLNGCMG